MLCKLSVTLALILAMAGVANAQGPIIDYLGYGWETGGFPTSDPGDELKFVGITTIVDPILGVDLSSVELTFYVYGLISTGEVDIAGNTVVSYTGGTLEIYADIAQNADFGINPPSPTVPGTFNDGILFFQGDFVDFTLFLAPSGGGSYEGNLDGVAGTLIDGICTGCAYTWGGAFTEATGAQIPAGYDLQLDGQLEVDPAVPAENSSWGDVKALFR